MGLAFIPPLQPLLRDFPEASWQGRCDQTATRGEWGGNDGPRARGSAGTRTAITISLATAHTHTHTYVGGKAWRGREETRTLAMIIYIYYRLNIYLAMIRWL